MTFNILIVDNEENVLSSLELALRKSYHVFCAETGGQALKICRENEIHIIFLDLGLDDMDGLEVLKQIKQIAPASEVIIITATNDIATAVNTIKSGAYDYITKPYEIDKLKIIAQKVSEKITLQNQVSFLESERELNNPQHFFIGDSKAFKDIKKLIRKLSSGKSTVLITGESGTGKEIVARAIHYSGKCSDKPFVPVHTGAISEGIIESELFGHEKGAFTGAFAQKRGKFEYADKGTIFLDEISTMPPNLQVKLLRVLQDKTFTRVGGTLPVKVDLRIIAATNSNLKDEVLKGKFREDLYYRLNVVNIEIPPLRERPSDIKIFALYFLRRYCQEFNKKINGFSDEVIRAFNEYHWPGNIRELQNIIERAVVLTENDTVSLSDLPMDFSLPDARNTESLPNLLESKKNILQVEKEYLLRVLKDCKWNKIETAKILGVHRNTILYRIKKLNIKKEYG